MGRGLTSYGTRLADVHRQLGVSAAWIEPTQRSRFLLLIFNIPRSSHAHCHTHPMTICHTGDVEFS
jgi:hypothetical protein